MNEMRFPHLLGHLVCFALCASACVSQAERDDKHLVDAGPQVDSDGDGFSNSYFDVLVELPQLEDASVAGLEGRQGSDAQGQIAGADARPLASDALGANGPTLDAGLESDAFLEQTPTFSRSVKQVFSRKCAPCHTTGRAGQRSLLSYADTQQVSIFCGVRTTAECAVDRIERGEMPPLFPRCSEDPLVNRERVACLNDAELGVLVQWIAAGMPP